MCAGARNSVSSTSSVKSSNHPGRPRKRSSESRLPFLHGNFGFDFWEVILPEACTSLRSWAGLVEDKSCDVDVEVETLSELVDNPATTRVTEIVRFAYNCLPFFGSDGTAGVSSSICTVTKRSKIVTVFLCFLVCWHFTIGRNHRSGVPGSSKSPVHVLKNLFAQHEH